MKIRKAVIPVAGLGTRFLPATKTVPKELLPIIDIPSIQYVVQEAVDAGIQEIIFVTGRGKDGIEDHFDEAPELEQILADRGQTAAVEMLRRIAEMTEVVSVRQKNHWAWDMRCFARETWSATSLLPSCSLTI